MASAYYQLIQSFSEDHVEFLANLDPAPFHYFMSSILEGLGMRDVKNAVCACVALDHLLSYHLKYLFKV